MNEVGDMKKTLLRILIGAVLVAACVSPALFVHDTSKSERITWLFWTMSVLIIPGLIGHFSAKNLSPELADYNRKAARWHGYVLVGIFSITAALSIVFVNISATEGLGAAIAKVLSAVTAPVFPWIGNFRAARVSWGLSDLLALKAEAIMAIWFAFGLIASVMLMARWLILTPKQKELESQLANTVRDSSWIYNSGVGFLFCAMFIILMIAMAYFGLWEFDDDDSKCLINARCYIHSDLMLIAAAAAKSFAIFGFSSGLVLMAWKFFSQPI